MTGPFTVAVDGPAAAGKGTLGRGLAERLGFAYLDTGLLYRAVGARVIEGEDPVAAARGLEPGRLGGDELRTPEVADAASKVAAMAEVREALVDFQRAFARRAGGAVLDGRDIGTVICPEAEVKLFVTASDTCRAARRTAELRAKGREVSEAEVLADMRERDARDSARSVAPLRPAADALVIDTTDMDIGAALEAALAAVAARRG